MSRYTPRRVLSIGAWTGAAVTWAMALLGEPTGVAATAVEVPIETVPVTTPSTALPALPTPPSDGLVILRFTPVPPPPPEVMVRTVSAPAQQAAPRVVVTSQGS